MLSSVRVHDCQHYAATIAAAARARRLQVAAAESCTGGLVCAQLTAAAGASQWFMGGVIAYSNEMKSRCLGVSDDLLAAQGAVSEAAACAMCDGLFTLGATAAVAITGIAGPGGGSVHKPVGLVWLAVRVSDQPVCAVAHHFRGDRQYIQAAATSHALQQLITALQGE